MKDLALLDGDIIFENGDFKFIEGSEEIIQGIGIELGSNLGEFFLNKSFGTDFKLLFGKSTPDEARSEVIRVLGKDESVDTIESVDVEDNHAIRKRSISYSITLVDGTVINEGVELNVG